MAKMTLYNVSSVFKGVDYFGTLFSNTVYSVTLDASTEATLEVPSDCSAGSISATTSKNRYLAVMTYGNTAEVWVSLNDTAAVPAGNAFAATTSELNPPGKVVAAGDVLSFITADDNTDVCVTFYALPEA